MCCVARPLSTRVPLCCNQLWTAGRPNNMINGNLVALGSSWRSHRSLRRSPESLDVSRHAGAYQMAPHSTLDVLCIFPRWQTPPEVRTLADTKETSLFLHRRRAATYSHCKLARAPTVLSLRCRKTPHDVIKDTNACVCVCVCGSDAGRSTIC